MVFDIYLPMEKWRTGGGGTFAICVIMCSLVGRGKFRISVFGKARSREGQP